MIQQLLVNLSLLSLWVTVQAAESSLVCERQGGTCPNERSEDCSLLLRDGWVLAGRNYVKGDSVGWRDVVIPFTIHDRRAFPKWKRNYYFLEEPGTHNYTFAPAMLYPFECHSRFWNFEYGPLMNTYSFDDNNEIKVSLNPQGTTTRALAVGDPLFMPCRNEELSKEASYEDFFPKNDVQDEYSTCLGALEVMPSTLDNAGWGSFATIGFKKGDVVASGPMIHMHRTELRNKVTDVDELLLNYCYGHPKSPLLLLPIIPGVNTINHNSDKSDVNVMIRWDMEENIFQELPTEILFEEEEQSKVFVQYVALQDIQPGQEIFLDYGDAWEAAWNASSLRENDRWLPFRHEIGLPPDMFPSKWLERETRHQFFPTLDTRKLKPLEVEPVRLLQSGELLSDGTHRIGFPEGLVDKLQAWGERIGVIDILKSYILNSTMTLKPDDEEHQRINGGNWWITRFPTYWSADMHYITPDCHESNRQFMEALGDAGFDQVLEAIGREFNLQSLTAYYPSLIAVSHATYAHMHSDSSFPGVFNLIFPVIQVAHSDPELILGTDNLSLHVPYKYERDHGCLLGMDGMHGTAPCDYRGTGQIRMVFSVYMGEFTKDDIRAGIVDEWRDMNPPYPRIKDRDAYLRANIHWHASDPTRTLKTPKTDISDDDILIDDD